MTPVERAARDGFCPFCLSIRNATSFVRAVWADGGQTDVPYATVTNPAKLDEWLRGCMGTDGFRDFIYDACNGAFIPVATWQGTPVCGRHLWMLIDRDDRKQWR